MLLRAVLMCVAVLLRLCGAFTSPRPSRPPSTVLGLRQISQEDTRRLFPEDEPGTATRPCYEFHLLEEEDLGAACQHLMACFYTTDGAGSSSGARRAGGALVQAASGALGGFLWLDAYLTYLLGFKLRVRNRLKSPDLRLGVDSCVLAASLKGERKIVGLVELSLERCDGDLPEPLPLLRLRSPSDESLQPYVCNLSVAPGQRGNGLSKRLMAAAEGVVRRWHRGSVYLHVKDDNVVAASLYRQLGYVKTTRSRVRNVDYYTKILRPEH